MHAPTRLDAGSPYPGCLLLMLLLPTAWAFATETCRLVGNGNKDGDCLGLLSGSPGRGREGGLNTRWIWSGWMGGVLSLVVEAVVLVRVGDICSLGRHILLSSRSALSCRDTATQRRISHQS
jgi:hypothetical protein